jgi:hypothetical protein
MLRALPATKLTKQRRLVLGDEGNRDCDLEKVVLDGIDDLETTRPVETATQRRAAWVRAQPAQGASPVTRAHRIRPHVTRAARGLRPPAKPGPTPRATAKPSAPFRDHTPAGATASLNPDASRKAWSPPRPPAGSVCAAEDGRLGETAGAQAAERPSTCEWGQQFRRMDSNHDSGIQSPLSCL